MFATCGERSRTKANIRWKGASGSSPEPALSKAEWARMTREDEGRGYRPACIFFLHSYMEASALWSISSMSL